MIIIFMLCLYLYYSVFLATHLNCFHLDVQFTKLLQLKLSEWPVTMKYCFNATQNCTFKDIFNIFSRNISRETTRIGIDGRFTSYLDNTDFNQYRGLLGISEQNMLNQTSSQILMNISNEYSKLVRTLEDNTIIELLIVRNINEGTAMSKDFSSLLTILASTTIQKLHYAKPYAVDLNSTVMQNLANVSMSSVNDFIHGFTAGPPIVLFLSIKNIINLYTGKINPEMAKAKHMSAAKAYRDGKSIKFLFSVFGKSLSSSQNESVIFIATEFLGITSEQMKLDGVSEKDIKLLSRTTVLDFNWIFPMINYSQSTIVDVQQNVTRFELVRILTNTFENLNVRANINLGNNSFTENIQTLTNYSANEIYANISERIRASLKGKSFVYESVFNSIINLQPLQDYAAKTKQAEASLYSMKIKDLAINMYNGKFFYFPIFKYLMCIKFRTRLFSSILNFVTDYISSVLNFKTELNF